MNPHYTATAKGLHWLMALLIFGLLALGFYMADLPLSPEKLQYFSWHKWAGVTVFLLVWLRLAWRVTHRPPGYPPTMTGTQQLLAHAGHFALYGLMVIIPLSGWLMSSAKGVQTVWFGVRDSVGVTEYLGYETERAEGVVAALIAGGQEVEALEAGQSGLVVLNQTPFYGESGGQVGDTGLMSAIGLKVRVTNTQKKLGDLFVHEASVELGALRKGQALELEVDHNRRSAIRANHSATHLLHEALRQVLGDHVAQKGSLVSPDRLRFDFAHPKPISDDELVQVEEIANRMVLQNGPVETRLMGVDEARASGARALFGEKYGDEVRVVTMGVETEGERAGKPFSIELCGGTHVRRTGDIGLVSIVGESAVASGVRRLEAKTADGARQHLTEEGKRLREIASLLKAPADDAAPVR